MSHTPGPWRWECDYEFHDRCHGKGLDADCGNVAEGRIKLVSDGRVIVLHEWAAYADDSGLTVSRADANLIAAAPDLLEALEAMVDFWGPLHEGDCPEDDTCDCNGKWLNDMVNAAHAKATRGVQS